MVWLVWSPCFPRDSQESSPEPQFENISSSALSLLYGPTLTSIHGHWMVWCACPVAQSCLTVSDPMDCSPPGFSVHGIFQARILEWVAISSSRVSSQPRHQTHVFFVSPALADEFFTTEPLGIPDGMLEAWKFSFRSSDSNRKKEDGNIVPLMKFCSRNARIRSGWLLEGQSQVEVTVGEWQMKRDASKEILTQNELLFYFIQGRVHLSFISFIHHLTQYQCTVDAQ